MTFPKRPRVLGPAVILGALSVIWRSRPGGLVVSVVTAVLAAVAIVQEYQRSRAP